MPLAFVHSNLPDSAFKPEFNQKLTTLIAEMLSKPAERITVIVEPGKRMTRDGTDEPTILFQLRSLAVFDETRNPDYFQKIYEFFEKEVQVPKGRTVIEFVDVPKHMVATQ